MRWMSFAGFFSLSLALILISSEASGQKKNDNNKKNNNPNPKNNDAAIDKKFDQWEKSQFEIMMSQHKSKFASFDSSRDNFLDEQELAVAFRGKSAKPPVRVAEAVGSEAPKTTAPATIDTKKYPDQEFLLAVDDDMDKKISLAEYLDWADDFAKVQAQQMRQAEETKFRIQETQLELARATTASQKQAIENRLQQQRLQLTKQQQNLKERNDNFQKHKKMKNKNNNNR